MCSPAPFFCIIMHVTARRGEQRSIRQRYILEVRDEVTLTYILVGLLEFREDLEARLHHSACPVVYFVILIRITADCVLYRLLDDLTDIVHDEQVLDECK